MKLSKFLELYKLYTSGNETPENIHTWVGLSTLAGAAEKRLWIPQGFFNIYLNLYILFVAPPGVCAKSTSMALGEQLLTEVGMNVFSSSTTKQKIVVDMCESLKVFTCPNGEEFKHSSITYMTDELNVLLDAGGTSIIKFLTAIFSKEDAYSDRTKGAGSYKIIQPYLNLLSAAVPRWFAAELASAMGTTGLLARFIILYETQKRGKFPRPEITIPQQAARAECLEMLFYITGLQGPMSLSPKADNFYREWYMEQEITSGIDERVVAYFDRKIKTHVPKVAGLMALGDGRKDIRKIDFERAIFLLNNIDDKLRSVYMMAGENRYGLYLDRIFKMLEAHGGIMQMCDIARAVYTDLTKDEFRAIIEQIEEMEIATRKRVNGKLLFVKIGDKRCQPSG